VASRSIVPPLNSKKSDAAINIVSGIVFVAADLSRFLPGGYFQVMLVLIVAAGINVLVFCLKVYRQSMEWAPDADVPTDAKLIAAVSLWL
jgi:protein-S-isoprenylcysteine O-methyltransferase Ste14